jgi:hypothetical protein
MLRRILIFQGLIVWIFSLQKDDMKMVNRTTKKEVKIVLGWIVQYYTDLELLLHFIGYQNNERDCLLIKHVCIIYIYMSI